jgi:hypothetical protein
VADGADRLESARLSLTGIYAQVMMEGTDTNLSVNAEMPRALYGSPPSNRVRNPALILAIVLSADG